jgi:hypothetical protein
MFTVYDLHKHFKDYNAKYFNNELPTVTLKAPNRKTVTRAGTTRWRVRFNKVEIAIFVYTLSPDWKKTLLHEMVHLYLYEKYGRDLMEKRFKTSQERMQLKTAWKKTGHTKEFYALLETYWNMETGRAKEKVAVKVSAPAPVRTTVSEIAIGSMVQTSMGIGKVVRKMLHDGRVLVYAQLASGNLTKHYPS